MLKRTLLLANKASIKTKNKQLVIHTEEREGLVPIEDIGFVVIEHPQTYITIPTINELVDNNVAVVFCNDKHMPSAMLLNLDSHYIQHTHFKNQIEASVPLKKQIWQQIIKEKITNQCEILKQNNREFVPMEHYANSVLSGDTDNREGAAARYYWQHIFEFDFVRERTGEYPNNLLNYGYIILRAAVARALSGVGLLNTLGIHHHNKYNSFCLADDIMEPYRVMIDSKVLEIINKNSDKELTTDIKLQLLSVLTQTVYFENNKSPFMVGLVTTCQSLQKCFSGETRKIIYPKLWN